MRNRTKVSKKSIKRRLRNKRRSNKKFGGGFNCDQLKGSLKERCLERQKSEMKQQESETSANAITETDGKYFYKGKELIPGKTKINDGTSHGLFIVDKSSQSEYKYLIRLSNSENIPINPSRTITIE